jgi:putative peptidoglycan lipid II flippase
MAAFVLSNLIGLVRQILITDAFGTSRDLDAFYAASRLPDLIFVLVAGGALASAFIPTFTELLATERREAAWKLASNIANLITLLLIGLSLAAMLYAEPIVQYLLAPGFVPDQQQLTAQLMRVLLITPAIFGLSGLMMGVLNAHQKFLLPALAPTMYWLGMIFGVLFLSPSMGIFGIAWGAVLGAILHLLIQAPSLVRLPDRRYTPSLGMDSPDVREVARLMGPRLLGVAVVQINFWINIFLASGQPEGSATALTIAWQLMTMPQVVIAQAIAIAALPTFSAQVAGGQLDDMRASLAATLRGVLLLSIPASIGLILLRDPLVAMLFQRGEFNQLSTQMVAWALLWYGLGLVSHSIVEVVSRAFYALHDTKTPVFVGAAAMTLNIGLSFLLAALFQSLGWFPHGGLALANTIATTLEMVGLLVLMRRRLQGLLGNLIARGGMAAAFAGLVMAAGVLFGLSYFQGLSVWVIGLGGTLFGALLYGLMLIVLRVPEIQTIFGALRRRVIPDQTSQNQL